MDNFGERRIEIVEHLRRHLLATQNIALLDRRHVREYQYMEVLEFEPGLMNIDFDLLQA